MRILSWGAVAIGASLLVTAGVARAQTKSAIGVGSWIVSGSANISHGSSGSSDGTSIAVAPSALYFFKPRWAFGGLLGGSYQKSLGYTVKSLAIGPEIRYYAAEPAAKTLPFVSFAIQPAWARQEAPNGGVSDSRSLDIDGSAGLTQLIATHVGLTGELYYTRSSTHIGSNTDVFGRYGLRFGITAFVF